jgi:hypothetical protein
MLIKPLGEYPRLGWTRAAASQQARVVYEVKAVVAAKRL